MKKRLLKILKLIITKLTTIYNKHTTITNQSKFHLLSPTSKAENVEQYLEALEWALENRNEIKNIAITGSYV